MLSATILLLAAAAIQPPKPLGAAGDWITPEDYPAEALAERRVGTTVFRLRVSVDGRPLQCEIAGSSGTAALDQKACAVLMERARFEPARNSEGRAIETDYENRVRWQLPDAVPFPPSDFMMEFELDTAGQLSNCNATDILAGHPAQESCERLAEDVRTMVRPQRPIRVRLRTSVEVEELSSDRKAPN